MYYCCRVGYGLDQPVLGQNWVQILALSYQNVLLLLNTLFLNGLMGSNLVYFIGGNIYTHTKRLQLEDRIQARLYKFTSERTMYVMHLN